MILDSGRAWERFRAICNPQGGLHEPPTAPLTHDVRAGRSGTAETIHNRRLARSQARRRPDDPEAGLELHVRLGDRVDEGDALFTVHAENDGGLAYALAFVGERGTAFEIRD